MTDISAPGIKIRRARKRLYDPIQEESDVSASPEDPAADFHKESEKTNDAERAVQLFSDDKSKEARADEIIKNYVAWSAGAALIPLPAIDMVAVTLIELKMLKELCDHYEIPFSEQIGKTLVASLIGGFHAGAFSGSLLKLVPVFGLTVATASIVVLSGTLTYAVGKVFVQHFETGGTLLNFDPSKMKAFFAGKYRDRT
ncbi:YcjF family protein [Desulfobacterales bacterium HSG2]|nr:YcjF family protein [Desulfobacterales bacterium HSG2]